MRSVVPYTLALALISGAVGGASSGCDAAPRPLPRVDRGPGPNASADPLGAALHHDVVARAGMMEEVGTIARGTLPPDGAAERSLILQAGFCFVVFVHTEPAAGELALRIVDSNGDPRQVDQDRGSAAAIGVADQLCPEPTTEYRLEMRAEHGGAYALRVFRTLAL